MKVKIFYSALITLTSVLLSSSGNRALSEVSSPYQVGQTWVVSAVYRQATATESWSPPILWRYKVENIVKDEEGNELAEIIVKDPEGVRSETVQIVLNLTTMNLVRVQSRFKMQGRIQNLTQKFNLNDLNAIDTPVTAAPYFVSHFHMKEFGSHSLGKKLIHVRAVTHEELESIKTEKSEIRGTADLSVEGLSAEIDKLVTIEISEGPNRKIIQIWKRNTAWPIYSYAHGCKAFLLESSSGGAR